MAIQLDYVKLASDQRVGVFGGPSGGVSGVDKIATPTEAEINNTGGVSGMIPFSQSLSWSDTELPGMQASESTNEPSLADAATFTEFGPSNYSGTLSMFRPRRYDDASNPNSLVYDLTDLQDWALLDFVVRIDGDTDALAPAEDGQYVTVTRQQTLAETESYDFNESARRTVTLDGKGGFAHYTIVGAHTLTVEDAPASFTVGDKGRFLVSVQGRDYTNALRFYSETPDVIRVYPGGFYEVIGEGAVDVTVTDEGADTTASISGTAA